MRLRVATVEDRPAVTEVQRLLGRFAVWQTFVAGDGRPN
jgi:hypothetical protein